jgi:hypothetical protein
MEGFCLLTKPARYYGAAIAMKQQLKGAPQTWIIPGRQWSLTKEVSIVSQPGVLQALRLTAEGDSSTDSMKPARFPRLATRAFSTLQEETDYCVPIRWKPGPGPYPEQGFTVTRRKEATVWGVRRPRPGLQTGGASSRMSSIQCSKELKRR